MAREKLGEHLRHREMQPSRLLLCIAAASALRKERLRILTYNIHAWRDGDHADNLQRVADTCLAVDADVICLNEVLQPYDGARQPASYFEAVKKRAGVGHAIVECAPREGYLQRLAAALGTPHVVFVEAEREQCFFGNCAFGNAILSRRPILDAGHVIARPAPGDILLGEQPRDSVEARAAVWASIGIGDERVGVCAAHLDHKADPLREKQLTLFLDELKRNAPALHLICGDLNAFQRRDHSAEAWDRILKFYESRGWPAPGEDALALDAAYAAGFVDAGAGFGLEPTCWTANPLFRIDHVLLNAALHKRCRVVDYRRVDSDASDHYPVVVDLEMEFK